MLLRGILLSVLGLVAPMAARGEEIGIIGDSIGEGLHLASNYPSPANRFNVAIYTPKIFEQIKEMPKGANVVMSLGTNDAVAGMVDAKPRVAQIVAAADAQGIKLTWVGPRACARPGRPIPRSSTTSSQRRSKARRSLTFRRKTRNSARLRCTRGTASHFTMAGYRLLWQKAATVAGIPVVVASAAEPRVGASNGPVHHGSVTDITQASWRNPPAST